MVVGRGRSISLVRIREEVEEQFVAGPLVDQRLVDHVAQLTNVSRPGVIAHGLERISMDSHDWWPRLFAREPAQKMCRQRGKVLQPIAERRDPDGHDGQALVEVAAEQARFDQRA